MKAVVYVYPANTDPSEITLPRDPTTKEACAAEFFILRPGLQGDGGHSGEVELVSYDACHFNGWVEEDLFVTPLQVLGGINKIKRDHDEVTWVYLIK